SSAVPRSAIEAVDASIIDPLLGMLAGGTNKDAHASALAMELLVVLASHPPFSGRLRAAGTIPAVAACLEDRPARGTAAEPGARASLMQLALIVLTGFLRVDGDQPAAAAGQVDEAAAEIAATRAHVRVVALLSAPDPKLRFTAAELALQLSRRCRPGPAPDLNRNGGGGDGIAKDMIEAGGLRALWRACSDPSPMARPVALEALATMLGTAAAMSRSSASSEAVLALVSEGAVGGLVRQHVDPALSVLGGGGRGRGVAGGGGSATAPGEAAAAAAAAATSALLALHFLAANPDPAVHGLFVAAAGVDEQQGGATRGGSTWSMILSCVEAGAEGRGGPAFLEAALLAAGSVCGAPPLPVLGGGGGAAAAVAPAGLA
ncbi:unnamed protein product, partial [Ectocarpus fasciculatus]